MAEYIDLHPALEKWLERLATCYAAMSPAQRLALSAKADEILLEQRQRQQNTSSKSSVQELAGEQAAGGLRIIKGGAR